MKRIITSLLTAVLALLIFTPSNAQQYAPGKEKVDQLIVRLDKALSLSDTQVDQLQARLTESRSGLDRAEILKMPLEERMEMKSTMTTKFFDDIQDLLDVRQKAKLEEFKQKLK